MSTAAICELIRANLEKFRIMIKDIPNSDKKSLLSALTLRVNLLENL